MKRSADDYLVDRDGNFILDDYGDMIRKPKPLKQKSSSDAERGRTQMRVRNAAKKNALAAMRNKRKSPIPPSPTR